MKKILVHDVPFYVYLQRDIPAGMELRYNYGDPKNINLQWRNNANFS